MKRLYCDACLEGHYSIEAVLSCQAAEQVRLLAELAAEAEADALLDDTDNEQ